MLAGHEVVAQQGVVRQSLHDAVGKAGVAQVVQASEAKHCHGERSHCTRDASEMTQDVKARDPSPVAACHTMHHAQMP